MLEPIEKAKIRIRERIDARREANGQPKMSDEQFASYYTSQLEQFERNSKFPPRYSDVSIADIPAKVQDALPIKDERGSGLYIWGGVGIGKTHSIYAIKKYYNERLISVSVRNVTELLQEIKASFDEKNQMDILDIYDWEHGACIAFDDMGAEKGSEWAGEQIYRLVNHIYENRLAFIFTSNLSLQELAARFGEVQGDRIASRIAEMSKVVELKGKDRRI